MSAVATVFLISGILFSSSAWCSIGSVCFWNHSLRRFMSNSSCWHGTLMSSGGSKYVYTHPVVRSTSKVDVKNSLSCGQLNSILPLPALMGSLSLIRSLIRVLLKFGTYQSRPISLCLLMYSSMLLISVLVNSTVGFRAAICWSGFGVGWSCVVMMLLLWCYCYDVIVMMLYLLVF